MVRYTLPNAKLVHWEDLGEMFLDEDDAGIAVFKCCKCGTHVQVWHS